MASLMLLLHGQWRSKRLCRKPPVRKDVFAHWRGHCARLCWRCLCVLHGTHAWPCRIHAWPRRIPMSHRALPVSMPTCMPTDGGPVDRMCIRTARVHMLYVRMPVDGAYVHMLAPGVYERMCMCAASASTECLCACAVCAPPVCCGLPQLGHRHNRFRTRALREPLSDCSAIDSSVIPQ